MNDTIPFIADRKCITSVEPNPTNTIAQRIIADHECVISVEPNPRQPATQRVLADFAHLPVSKFATLSVVDGNVFTLNATWNLVRDQLLDVLHEEIAFTSAYTEGGYPEYSDTTLVFIVAADAVPDAIAAIAGHLDAFNIDCGVIPL